MLASKQNTVSIILAREVEQREWRLTWRKKEVVKPGPQQSNRNRIVKPTSPLSEADNTLRIALKCYSQAS